MILNRNGVGIAADSTATVAGTGRKTYFTVDKLFELSAAEPVAAMIYGSSVVGPFPWETLIKEYRSELSRSHPTVSDYTRDFLEYLKDKMKCMSVEDRNAHFLTMIRAEFELLRDIIFADIVEAIGQEKTLNVDNVRQIVSDAIRCRLSTVAQFSNVANTTPGSIELKVAEVPEYIDRKTDELLRWVIFDSKERARALTDFRAMMVNLILASLSKAAGHPGSSGLVVVGFGDEELLPALAHFRVDGVIDDGLRVSEIEERRIDSDNPVHILPYGQTEVVYSFIEGVHPGYKDAIFNSLSTFVDQLQNSCGRDSDLGKYCTNFYDMLVENADRYVLDHHYRPVERVAESLPRDELAEMAEALVELTSFTRRFTPGVETVGGPIDVAVITRGDGLVWVNQKNHFRRLET